MTGSVNRDRLAKVLALMSSPVDGEALAAARMVVKLLADAGLRPEQLVDGIPAERVVAPAAWAWTTPWDIRPTAPQPRSTAARPKEPSVRDLGPVALRRVLDDLLGSKPWPLLPKHAAFVREIRERIRVAPHLGLNTGEVRRLNQLWRAWRVAQQAAA